MTEIIYGRFPVLETLRAKRRSISRIEIAKGIKKTDLVSEILNLAANQNIPIVEQPRKSLDKIRDHNQGMLANCSSYPYRRIERIANTIDGTNQPVLILLLDIIQNPQNLGTLLRTAEAVGVDGVILPLRRGVGVTPAVVRASAGASEHLSIAQHNLAQAIKLFKELDLWIYGLENSEDAVRFDRLDLPSSVGIIVGGEGEGLRRLNREACDQLIHLPMRGKVESLNAAVAGSIALYAIWQSRGFV